MTKGLSQEAVSPQNKMVLVAALFPVTALTLYFGQTGSYYLNGLSYNERKVRSEEVENVFKSVLW